MENVNINDIINTVVKSSEAELKLLITEDVPRIVNAAQEYLSNLATRSTALLGVVTDSGFKGDKLAFVLARIKDEKIILETEVFSFIIIGQGVAQNIINSIQGIIIDAIQAVLPTANVE